jgi:hypothetical protein
MSSDRPIRSGRAWLQGLGIVAIANIFIWIALVGLNWRMIPVWAICFGIMNAASARFVFPLCEDINIPSLWSNLIHPIAITGMCILFGGAVGLL